MTEKEKRIREGMKMLLEIVRNPPADKKEEEAIEEEALGKIFGRK